ncbi:MAG: hypothetical protein JNK82_13375 [Myxococcaceae bacterium]|nr:hypothetical protein [Myxococcaceae bacterium]
MVALALALGACAPEAAVWLRIEAPLRVPAECDAIDLRATRVAGGAEVYAARHELHSGPTPFPLELALSTNEPDNLGQDAVELEVRALKGGVLAAPWAQKKQRLALVRGQWAHATIELCDCP